MIEIDSTWQGEYQRHRDEGLKAVERGSLHEALAFFRESLGVAKVAGDAVRGDQARLSVASVEIELGRVHSPGDLPAILLRSGESENAFFAAYNLARFHDRAKDSKKALFYARVANRHARRLARNEIRAMSHNQLGDLLLAQSFFPEATRELERALEQVPAAAGVKRALILDNLGYCHVVQGDYAAGFKALFDSLRTLRRFGAPRYQSGPRISLCFAYLERGRANDALRHGMAAATLAERFDDRETLKNALFLLGEAQKLAGDELAARRHFRRLQERFYPGESYLPDLLLLVDVRNMVNLKA
jgi:tetratricopeptide (TPR) repeat protein